MNYLHCIRLFMKFTLAAPISLAAQAQESSETFQLVEAAYLICINNYGNRKC